MKWFHEIYSVRIHQYLVNSIVLTEITMHKIKWNDCARAPSSLFYPINSNSKNKTNTHISIWIEHIACDFSCDFNCCDRFIFTILLNVRAFKIYSSNILNSMEQKNGRSLLDFFLLIFFFSPISTRTITHNWLEKFQRAAVSTASYINIPTPKSHFLVKQQAMTKKFQ